MIAFTHRAPRWSVWRALLAAAVAVWCWHGALTRIAVSNERVRRARMAEAVSELERVCEGIAAGRAENKR